jgi:hypothetical protein
MNGSHPSPLSEYFAYLEAKYGEQFGLDALTHDELSRLALLGEQAINTHNPHQQVSPSVGGLLNLVQGKLRLRERDRLLADQLSS